MSTPNSSTTAQSGSNSNSKSELPRLIHESALHPMCLVTNEPKYIELKPNPMSPIIAEVPDPPANCFKWADLSYKRPSLPSQYINAINKMVQAQQSAVSTPRNSSSTTSQGGLRQWFSSAFGNNNYQGDHNNNNNNKKEKKNTKKALEQISTLTIPTDHYASDILHLADKYGGNCTVPALLAGMKNRNRFGNGGFVAEKHRVPLSLYSTPYLEKTGNNYVNIMTSRRMSPVLNDPIDVTKLTPTELRALHKEHFETHFDIEIKAYGCGDFANASDIIPPMLFREQYNQVNDENEINGDDDETTTPFCIDDYVNYPTNITPISPLPIPLTTYIGSHAPTEQSMDVFYQIIFEQRVRMVVALTLSEPYWPVSSYDDNDTSSAIKNHTKKYTKKSNKSVNINLNSTCNVNDDDDDSSSYSSSSSDDDSDDDDDGYDDRYTTGRSKQGDIGRYGNFLVRIDKVEEFSTSRHVIARHITIIHDPIHLRDNKINNDDIVITPDNSVDCVLLLYVAWPDMGVPELKSFTSFYNIYLQLKQRLEEQHQYSLSYTTRPISGHCLAGIGRLGCFITIDIILSHLNSFLFSCGIVTSKSSPYAHLRQFGQNNSNFNDNILSIHQNVDDNNDKKINKKLDKLQLSTFFRSKLLLGLIPYVILNLRSCRRGMVQTPDQVIFIARFVSSYINTIYNNYLNDIE